MNRLIDFFLIILILLLNQVTWTLVFDSDGYLGLGEKVFFFIFDLTILLLFILKYKYGIKVMIFNLSLLLTLLFLLELIFGGWIFGNQINHQNIIKNSDIKLSVEGLYNWPAEEIIYKRDEFGFRSKYNSINSIDIITVGGSTTDQRYISEGFTFQDVLRDQFYKNGKEVSIVNAGIDGQSTYGHLQNFDYWFNKIPNLKTKYFLFFIGVNDFFVQSGPMGGDIHYHSVNNNVNQDLMKMIMSKSILYHFIKVLSGNITAYSYDLRHEVNMPFSEIVWTSKLKTDNHKDLMKTFLKDYEKRLIALLGRVKEYGAKSIIVTQSSRRVYDNSNEILKGQKDYMQWGGKLINGTDYYYMINLLHERTEKVANQSGALFIDLNQNLNFDLENDFYDHCHFSPSGADKIGKFLYKNLKHLF